MSEEIKFKSLYFGDSHIKYMCEVMGHTNKENLKFIGITGATITNLHESYMGIGDQQYEHLNITIGGNDADSSLHPEFVAIKILKFVSYASIHFKVVTVCSIIPRKFFNYSNEQAYMEKITKINDMVSERVGHMGNVIFLNIPHFISQKLHEDGIHLTQNGYHDLFYFIKLKLESFVLQLGLTRKKISTPIDCTGPSGEGNRDLVLVRELTNKKIPTIDCLCPSGEVNRELDFVRQLTNKKISTIDCPGSSGEVDFVGQLTNKKISTIDCPGPPGEGNRDLGLDFVRQLTRKKISTPIDCSSTSEERNRELDQMPQWLQMRLGPPPPPTASPVSTIMAEVPVPKKKKRSVEAIIRRLTRIPVSKPNHNSRRSRRYKKKQEKRLARFMENKGLDLDCLTEFYG